MVWRLGDDNGGTGLCRVLLPLHHLFLLSGTGRCARSRVLRACASVYDLLVGGSSDTAAVYASVYNRCVGGLRTRD